ncbi:pro-Pol polyprotein [Trichonephila clavata]|uniref:Pro-Pol polyprotein n=1 Tax=Trichonephila clavata TaxID=2740835 RepID=A0A8X6JF49_TRICU|nr:pro-Pol polyprotein [Trichonephila clavata]
MLFLSWLKAYHSMSSTDSENAQYVQTVEVPDLDNIDNINLNKRLWYQQRLTNVLRSRFRDEYSSLLVHQEINKAGSKQVRVGDVVLVSWDNKNRLDWQMGLVMEVFPGKDNSVRVVKVKTRMGELIRSVTHYILWNLSDSKIYNSLLFKNVKDIHSKFNNCNNQTDYVNLEIKTKCGRKVAKPKRYDN